MAAIQLRCTAPWSTALLVVCASIISFSDFLKDAPRSSRPTVSAAVTQRPDSNVSRDFVAWWLTDAMDYSDKANSSRHRAAGWMNSSDVVNSFKTQFWDAGDNYQKKRLMYKLADCWTIDTNAEGLVRVRTFGVVISDAKKHLFQFLTVDFLVDRNEDGYRVASFEFPEAQNNAVKLTKFIANASDANIPDAEVQLETKSRRNCVHSIVWFARGYLRDQFTSYPGALDSYSEAIKADPTDSEAYIERSSVKRALGDKKGALEDSKLAATLMPADAPAHYACAAHYAYALNLQLSNRLSAAESEYSECIRLEPAIGVAHCYRGEVRCALGKTAEGFNDLNTAIRLSPTRADFYMRKALLEEKRGHISAAVSDLRRAHQLEPKIEKWPAWTRSKHLLTINP